ncbi:C6 zinc finger domain-containing protein [Ilyonectria sp. MPI-CAGE-AT-0026]|nr:C6 zinc finger domain-containing protein [Ilyonectria sp. MPI-CAGE-AT-0026]
MPPALGYKKSRTGCLRCKQRKVKCDENRPCHACVRHGVVCTLVMCPPEQAQPSSAGLNQGGEQIPQENSVVTAQLGASASHPAIDPALSSNELSFSFDPYSYFARFTTHDTEEHAESNTGSWIGDLELMHHWSTHTHSTLPRAKDANNVWQFEVPKIAIKHQFLMNQLLALSAFHLAYLNPGQRHVYALRASQHQDHAVRLMRTALAEITAENCDALFAASLLCSFGGFSGVTNQTNGLEPSVDDILDIFLLTRGIDSVLKTEEDNISKGALHEFFGLPKHPVPSMPAGLQALLDKLIDLQLQLETHQLDDHIQALVGAEIISLISCIHYANATAPMPEVRIVSTWPMHFNPDFITLLRQRHPAAVALLAYFCVVVRITESTFWFMKGWGLGVARSIANTIDPLWNSIIEWPMGYIAAQDIAS